MFDRLKTMQSDYLLDSNQYASVVSLADSTSDILLKWNKQSLYALCSTDQ